MIVREKQKEISRDSVFPISRKCCASRFPCQKQWDPVSRNQSKTEILHDKQENFSRKNTPASGLTK